MIFKTNETNEFRTIMEILHVSLLKKRYFVKIPN